MVEFPRSGQEKQNKAAAGEENWKIAMKFTGTLIEDLMATVERAEKRAQADRALSVEALATEPMLAETSLIEPWFASVPKNADYDSKFLGVA